MASGRTEYRGSSFPPPPSREGGEGGPRSAAVFITDPSAQAERLARALRVVGYYVVDVPLSRLSARVAVQRPSVVLLDADAEGADEAVASLRKTAGGGAIDLIFVGSQERSGLAEGHEALELEASGFFPRPLDVAAIVRKIESLVPLDQDVAGARGGTTPPPGMRFDSIPPAASSDWPSRGESAVADPPRVVTAYPMSITPPPAAFALAASSPRPGFGAPMSDDLKRILRDAEEHAEAGGVESARVPSPDEEVEAVLPFELLAALDEPIGLDDGELEAGVDAWATAAQARDAADGAPMSSGVPESIGVVSASSASVGASSVDGTAAFGTRSSEPPQPETMPPSYDQGSTPPPPAFDDAGYESYDGDGARGAPTGPPSDANGRVLADTTPPLRSLAPGSAEGRLLPDSPPLPSFASNDPRLPSDTLQPVQTFAPGSFAATAPPTSPTRTLFEGLVQQASVLSLSPSAAPVGPAVVVHDEGGAAHVIARAVAERYTGAVCAESGGSLRRVVLRDGDFVTAGSGDANETLVGFLASRGEVPREMGQRLRGKLAPFGRLAGAALVARGYVSQDRLWAVLRGHAEWLIERILLLTEGVISFEREPPGRLGAEPSVFGGSTGAEVFVEAVRRVVTPGDALRRLGGRTARLADGPNRALLSECALAPHEGQAVERATAVPVSELAAHGPMGELAPVLYALVALGIFSVGYAPEAARSADVAVAPDGLDAEAFRAGVRARLELVEEGDYFALLGIAPSATAYEIRRAYSALRRAFGAPGALTASTADLGASLALIVEVLDEAYEVLRDDTRRGRYRRALGIE